MALVSVGDVSLYVEERGAGQETVVFSHSYLADHRHFAPQIERLSQTYRVLAYDHRDHGQSGKARGPYDLQRLVDDGIAVLETLGGGPCHWVGLSTGGFVGMRIALQRPDLLKRLVLMDTSAQAEPRRNRFRYEGMFLMLRLLGFGPVAKPTMDLMFARGTLENPQLAPMVDEWRQRITSGDPAAIVRFGRAIFSRDDILSRLNDIQSQTLVVVGADDRATPPGYARRIAAAIPSARLSVVDGAGHLSTLEQPDVINELLLDFLAAREPASFA